MKNLITFISLLFLYSCTSYIEPIEGLCHNDNEGSFLCDCPKENRTYHGHCVEPEEIYTPKPVLPETYPPGYLNCERYNLIEYCEGRNRNNLRCSCITNRLS